MAEQMTDPLILEGVTLIQITNPLDPREHTRTVVAWKDGGTLIDYLTVARLESVVAVSGGLVAEDEYQTRLIHKGDTIVVCPVPQGGGKNKGFLRIIALIAVAVFAPYASAAIAPGLVGTAAGTALTAGIAIAGNLLVNTLLPVQPLTNGNPKPFNDSPSYGIDGASTTARDGTVIPLIYGKFRTGGNRIASFTENVTSKNQDYYSLQALCEGDITAISDIYVNQQPIANFSDVNTQYRLGLGDQTSIDWFDDTITQFDVSALVTQTFQTRTTNGPVDKFRVDLLFPQGLIQYDDKGEASSRQVVFDIEYRKVGDIAFVPLTNVAENYTNYLTGYVYTDVTPPQTLMSLRPGTNQSGDVIYKNGVAIGYVVKSPTLSFSLAVKDKSRNPVRASFKSPILERAQYEVRVRRQNAESADPQKIDTVTWSALGDVITQPFQYPHTALLGVKIKLSDQLNSVPNITALVHGKKINVRRVKDSPTTVSETNATFTRASSGTAVDASGNVVSFASNTIRPNYHPISNVLLGYLFEPARTNSLLQSEDLTQAIWTKTECTITAAGAIVEPDNTTGAQKLVPSTNNTEHLVVQSVTKTGAAQTWAFPVWLKAAELTRAVIRVTGAAGTNGYQAAINLSAGTIAAPTIIGTGFTSAEVSIEPFKNGWYRCTLKVVTDATTTLMGRVVAANAAGATTYAGNGTDGLYVWGAQLENADDGQAWPTSYIKTTTTTVSRAQDVATFPTASIPGLNKSAMTVLVEFHVPTIIGAARVVEIGETTNRVLLRLNNGSPIEYVEQGGVIQANSAVGAAVTAGAINRVAITAEPNRFAGSVNGSAVVIADNSGSFSALGATMTIGSGGTTALCGSLKRLVIYDRVLSDEDLVNITQSNADYVREGQIAMLGPEQGLLTPVFGDPSTNYEWVYQHSANPAWIVYDMITSVRYGAGIASSRIDLEKWQEWANYCDDEDLEFNGIFDTQTNIWDAMQYVLYVGHAQILNVGTRYSLAIEKADSPVMLFNVSSIKRGTFKTGWLPFSGRSNDIDLTYFDATNFNKENTVRVTNPDTRIDQIQRPVSITAYGIDDALQAQREAVFRMNLNRLVRSTCSFEATIEAIACTVGDQVLVQHDRTNWGQGGKTGQGSTNTLIVFDRAVEFLPGQNYSVLVNFDRIRRAAGKITNISGKLLYLSDWNGIGAHRRITTPDQDVKTLETISLGGGNYAVRVDSVAGFAINEPYELWDTDVIETAPVNNPAGLSAVSVTQVTTSVALTAVPGALQNWLVGITTAQIKPWRVTGISGGSDEYSRTLSCVEYQAQVYNLTTELAPLNLDTFVPMGHVTNLMTDEQLTLIGSVFRSLVILNWDKPASGSYSGANIFASINGGTFEQIGSVRHGLTSFTHEAQEGLEIIYRVVAVDALGVAVPQSSAPTASITVQGKTAPPAPPTNLLATVTESGVILTWTESTAPDRARYEVRVGPNWETGTTIGFADSNFVRLGAQASGSYTYWVKCIDTSGIYSATAATTTLVLTGPGSIVFGSTAYTDGSITLNWTAPTSQLPVTEYELRKGASFGTSVSLGRIKTTTYNTPVNWSSETFYVAAIDSAGTMGAFASISSTIIAPTSSNLRAEIVDNNVLLRWSTAAGTLPVAYHTIEKVFNSVTSTVGQATTTFAAVFESRSGTITYKVTPVDTAGNTGGTITVVAKVDEPPDFVFTAEFESTFEGYKSSFLKADGVMYGPFNITETYDQHYSTRSWTNDQDAINAGYPNYGHPSPLTGVYEEVYDTGYLGAGSRIIIEPSSVQVSGVTTTAYQISTALDNKITAPYDMTGAGFTASNVTVTTNTGNAVDGSATADTVDDTNAAAFGFLAFTGQAVSAGQVWTAQLDVEKQSAGTNACVLRLAFTGGSAVFADISFDPNSGAFATPFAGARAYVRDMGTHWRISVTGTAGAGNTTVAWQFYPASGSRSTLGTYAAAQTGSLKVSNAHLIGPWTDQAPGEQAYSTAFRYIKVMATSTNTNDTAVHRFTALKTTLKSKLKNDQGTVSVQGTTAGGANGHKVTVNFATDFLDVQGITVTVNGTAPKVAIVNFTDVPNPVSFEIQVYETNGTPVAAPATVSWIARGY